MIKIEILDHEGKGIGYINNKITFIKNALPNEIVEENIIKDKKKYSEAKINKIVEKSKERIDNICPYFNICGGCDIQHMNYDYQLKFKQEKIANIVNKYLKKDIKINTIVKSNNIYNYRNKVTFQVNNNIGFFEENTNNIIEINYCNIAHNLINNCIPYLKKLNLKEISQIICRVGNNKLMIIISTTNNNLDVSCIEKYSDSIYLKVNDNYILVKGDKYIYQNIGNKKYIISPNSFFQINIDIAEKLYNKIKDYTIDSKNILDLYCGTGSIGIYISNDYNNITGIEINNNSIKDANKNKIINNINNINFICNDSAKGLNNIRDNFDTVIVDPPRNGLNINTINQIFKINPNKIVYVSCDVMTLVRDLNTLSEKYNIIELTPFDMFPNTKHCESVVVLEK